MIKLDDIFIVFQPNTPAERIAVRGVNLTINDGEFVALVGGEGSGRTSFLRFLAGHIPASFGKLRFNGIDITRQTLQERSTIFSSVFCKAGVSTAENMTVYENIALSMLHHQQLGWFAPAQGDDMRDMVFDQLKNANFMGMENLMDTCVGNVGIAYKHMLALLMALNKGAQVLLVDELSTDLDRVSEEKLLAAIEGIARDRRITTIMAMRDVKFAFEHAERTLVFKRGRISSDSCHANKNDIKIEDIILSL